MPPRLKKKLGRRGSALRKKKAPRKRAVAKKKEATVVSFFGGPGAGKSTLAAGVFHKLKQDGVNCEFVHEFAKELAWEGRAGALSNQTLILGQQYEMFRRCIDQVDVIITDTSLLCSLLYTRQYDLPYAEEIEALAVKMYRSMDNLPFLVNRVKPYNPVGRYQDEEGALDVDRRVRAALSFLGAGFREIPGDDLGVQIALDEVKRYREGGLAAITKMNG